MSFRNWMRRCAKHGVEIHDVPGYRAGLEAHLKALRAAGNGGTTTSTSNNPQDPQDNATEVQQVQSHRAARTPSSSALDCNDEGAAISRARAGATGPRAGDRPSTTWSCLYEGEVFHLRRKVANSEYSKTGHYFSYKTQMAFIDLDEAESWAAAGATTVAGGNRQ